MYVFQGRTRVTNSSAIEGNADAVVELTEG